MAKYNDLKAALKYIREGYGEGKEPFRFTASQLAEALGLSEKKTREVLGRVNVYARFWKGRFPASGHNFIVSSQVFDRIRTSFE
ncbi:glycosyl transferase family protein [Pseudodesulfovibrio mercurii]|uniref:Glycosyl transferase family protein n=1 Tax=Pseudodesulfovibrio mercurii TaxID=641491 RepID=F0JCP2_9BACT|nr:glycosyl transferase [Pseudodesulfovibrio mercurii]EGB15722.1 glycosyl transferase family protein [Pseudodesulfovibrio mercurii]